METNQADSQDQLSISLTDSLSKSTQARLKKTSLTKPDFGQIDIATLTDRQDGHQLKREIRPSFMLMINGMDRTIYRNKIFFRENLTI